MPTDRQRAAVDKIVETGGKSVSKAMREAKLKNGEPAYTPATAQTPQKLTESKGYSELCEQHGLTDSLLLKSLVSDIKAKKKNRKSELELGFKIKGRLQEQPNETKSEPVIITQNILNVIVKAEDEVYKELKKGNLD